MSDTPFLRSFRCCAAVKDTPRVFLHFSSPSLRHFLAFFAFFAISLLRGFSSHFIFAISIFAIFFRGFSILMIFFAAAPPFRFLRRADFTFADEAFSIFAIISFIFAISFFFRCR